MQPERVREHAEPLRASASHDLARLRGMLLIRCFEERAAEMHRAGRLRGFVPRRFGEEAVVVGAMRALEPGDEVVSTCRAHGLALARGVPAARVMAAMSGGGRGRGGSMHLFDALTRFYGGDAAAAGALPAAVSLALADAALGRRRVMACLFGEGATAGDELLEALSLAVLWRLPVLFLYESGLDARGAPPELCVRARSLDVRVERVDGADVTAVERGVRSAAARAREGRGPAFVEFGATPASGRSIAALTAQMRFEGALDDADLARLEAEVCAEVDGAAAFAEAAHRQPLEDQSSGVYAAETLDAG